VRFWRASLKDTIDIKEWQNIQDTFSVVTSVGLRTIDERGEPITSVSGESRLCRELIKPSEFKNTICGKCLPTFLGGEQRVNRNLDFVCLPGLHNFVAPLTSDNGKVLGYLILGPMFFITRNPKDEYRPIAEELKIDLDELWSALLEIKVTSFYNAQSLIKLITGVAGVTLKYAYKAIRKEKELEVSSQLNKILNVLLDVAFQISNADVGSIMFFKKSGDILTIQSSKGIPLDIANATKVRLGEGISGMVAQENRPLLIDDDLSDNRIKSRLNRPKLKSAMVLPINSQNRVVGIMNLGVLRSSPVKFDTSNVRLMNKLIDLATVVINPSR